MIIVGPSISNGPLALTFILTTDKFVFSKLILPTPFETFSLILEPSGMEYLMAPDGHLSMVLMISSGSVAITLIHGRCFKLNTSGKSLRHIPGCEHNSGNQYQMVILVSFYKNRILS